VGGLTNLIRALGAARILALGLVAAGLIGFFGFVSVRMTTPPMAVLYSDLQIVDAAEITERLRGLQVPYQLVDNGRTILAPADRVLELRMEFAADGLGGTVGYELLDRQDALGTTSFLQNVNHRRALEGELARTIKTINIVQEARVHLVLPERELFSRHNNKPSAAVSVRTKGGKLSATQVESIRQLVAASVPDLEPGQVSIVDQTGMLLARIEESGENAMVGRLHERQRAIEGQLRDEIEDLVARVVGPGHVRAEVAAVLDFERVSEESESFDPDGQVVVSSNTVERSESDTARASGGGTSVANNLPDAQQAAGTAPTQSSSSGETQETINYDNSRTRVTRVKESGEVRRLSVAVLVDGAYSKADDGTVTYTPRSEAQLDQIARLVKNAIGFDEGRGDSVEIANLRFAEADEQGTSAEESVGMFAGLPVEELQRVAEILVLGVVTILVLFLVVRPIVKRVLEALPDPKQTAQHIAMLEAESRPQLAPPEPAELTAQLAARAVTGDDEALEKLNEIRSTQQLAKPLSIEAEIDVAQVEGKLKSSALKKVGEIVERHPEESAAIVRQWLYST